MILSNNIELKIIIIIYDVIVLISGLTKEPGITHLSDSLTGPIFKTMLVIY